MFALFAQTNVSFGQSPLEVILGGGMILAFIALFKAKADKEGTVAGSAATVARGVSEAAAALVGPLSEEVTKLRERVVIAERKNEECEQRADTFGREVNDLRQQIDQLGMSSAIFDTFAVVIVDPKGHTPMIVEASDTLSEMLGWKPGELAGHSLERLIPVRFHEAHRHHTQSYIEDPMVRSTGMDREVWVQKKDGSEMRVWIGLAPLNGMVAAVVLPR